MRAVAMINSAFISVCFRFLEDELKVREMTQIVPYNPERDGVEVDMVVVGVGKSAKS